MFVERMPGERLVCVWQAAYVQDPETRIISGATPVELCVLMFVERMPGERLVCVWQAAYVQDPETRIISGATPV